MIIEETQVSRRNIKEDRIAICPHLGCKYLEKIKPIKMRFFSFRKYPKCPKHRLALVFVDEFIGNFFDAVNACLFDVSSLPPNMLISNIRSDIPDELKSFINLWLYSNPIGRGGQIISPYIDGLSKGYMKLLSRKQKKAIRDEKYNKKYEMLRLGLKKIIEEYTQFLREFYEKSKMVYEQKDLRPLSKKTQLIIKGWLKNHLANIKDLNNSRSKDNSLIAYKQFYDMILHAGTCSLLVGKAPSIVIKGISAFDLFSTYHEFLKAGLCKKLKKEKIKRFSEESQEFLYIDEKNNVERTIIEKKSRLENKKGKIEYSIKGEKSTQIEKSFLNYSHKLKKIKDKIALFVFESAYFPLNKSNEFLTYFKDIVLKDDNEQYFLTRNERDILQQMNYSFPEQFDKYFLDLVKIIEFLKNRAINLKKINAHLLVKPTSEYLYKRGITLFYKPSTFVGAVTEIFDYLKEKHQDFFPNRVKMSSKNDKKHNSEGYRLILGYNLKLYLMKTIYNGRYNRNGRLNCPECFKEGYLLNTNELRLTSLEFHHSMGEKENEYTMHKLSRIYQKQSSNEQFLEELIKQMENEGVIVLCRNHHHILHSKYFSYFRKLINWKNIPPKFPQDIFSLPPELILLLIKISVENFSNTKNESYHTKMYIRNTIARYLKKRYLIEHYYGKVCHSCGEFSLSDYLPSFDFHHYSGKKFQNNPYLHSKIKDASQLFIQSYTCSEIAQILEYEKGGFICRNCHNVLEYKLDSLDLLDDIYHNENIIQLIRDDNKSTNQKFQIFHTSPSIKNPLSINTQITETYEKYLNAIYDLTQQNRIITIANLAQNLDCNRVTVLGILKAKEFFFNIFLNKEIGKNRLKIFILTERGNNYIELIHYLKDYYRKKSLIKI